MPNASRQICHPPCTLLLYLALDSCCKVREAAVLAHNSVMARAAFAHIGKPIQDWAKCQQVIQLTCIFDFLINSMYKVDEVLVTKLNRCAFIYTAEMYARP